METEPLIRRQGDRVTRGQGDEDGNHENEATNADVLPPRPGGAVSGNARFCPDPEGNLRNRTQTWEELVIRAWVIGHFQREVIWQNEPTEKAKKCNPF